MSKIFNIKTFTPSKEDKFFFDANVLIYINSIHTQKPYLTKVYSNFLDKILRAESEIYISSLVLSEFINKEFKVSLSNYKGQSADSSLKPKQYRNTPDGKKQLNLIAQNTKRLLKNLVKINDNFKSINTNELVESLELCDFNDRYFMHLCEIEDLKIVTNDGDFASCSQNVDIITANKKLLSNN